jgi:hypothetical protein
MDWRQLLSHVIQAGRGNVEAAESKGIDTGRNAPPLCGDKVMIEKNVQPRQPSGESPTTQPVIDLLTSILNEVRSQVLLKTPTLTPTPLTGDALTALNLFTEIGAALGLQPLPTIKLTATPDTFPASGGKATLTWTLTAAQTVSIDNGVGDVTPVAGDTGIIVSVPSTTTYTATATGPCGSAQATAKVTVASPV